MALLYDAVIAFAETTKSIQYVPQPLDCKLDADNVQEDGSTFKNYMRSVNYNSILKILIPDAHFGLLGISQYM